MRRMISTCDARLQIVSPQTTALKPALDRLYADFNYADSATDPIQIVRRFDAPTIARWWRSARRRWRSAAWRACCSRSSGVLAIIGPTPGRRTSGGSIRGATLRRSTGSSTAGRASADIVALLWMLGRCSTASGSIEGFFLEGYDPAAADVGDGARQLFRRARWRST